LNSPVNVVVAEAGELMLVSAVSPETRVNVDRNRAVGVEISTMGPLTFLAMPKASVSVRVEPATSTALKLK